jgi:hypothetical protein
MSRGCVFKRLGSAGILMLTASSMAVRTQGSEQGTGSISGVVVSEAGKPVVKALVELKPYVSHDVDISPMG